jgi:hypothetical protein
VTICLTCGGSGLYSRCIDDLCYGEEVCIHGDDATCPDCKGEGGHGLEDFWDDDNEPDPESAK